MQTRSQRREVRKARKNILKAKPYRKPEAAPAEFDSLPVQATTSSESPVLLHNPENDRFPDYSEMDRGKKRRSWFAPKGSSRPKPKSTRKKLSLAQQRPSYPCCPHSYHEAYCGELRQRVSPEQIACMLPFRKHKPCPVHTSKVDLPSNWHCCVCKKGRNHDWSMFCGTCGHERGGEGCECPGTDFKQICEFLGMTSLTSQQRLRKLNTATGEDSASGSTESETCPVEESRSDTQTTDFDSGTWYDDSGDDFAESEPFPSREDIVDTERRSMPSEPSNPSLGPRKYSWESESDSLPSQGGTGATEVSAFQSIPYRRVTWEAEGVLMPAQEVTGGTYVAYSPPVRRRKFSWETGDEDLPSPGAANPTEVSPVPYIAYSPPVWPRKFSWEAESQPHPSPGAARSTEVSTVPRDEDRLTVRSNRFSWAATREPVPPQEVAGNTEVRALPYVAYSPPLRSRRFSWESEEDR
ncbi:MAG: hypothetical protein M1812_006600 [Candelaria pacifica]|nr:MAG: hypothetical protein M1812_006600 [Candelaria pacifica]